MTNKHSFLLGLTTVAASLWLAAAPVHASVLASANFETNTLSGIATQGGGAGWGANNWTGNAGSTVVTSPVLDYPVPGGADNNGGAQALSMTLGSSTSSTIMAARALATPLTGTNVFLSYLWKYSGAAAGWTGSSTFSIYLSDTATDTGGATVFNVGMRYSGGQTFMVRTGTGGPGTGGAITLPSGSIPAVGNPSQTYMIVAEFVWNGSSYNQINAWINPSNTMSAPMVTNMLGGAGLASLAYVLLREGVPTANDVFTVDNLLIGTTWTDVVPNSPISVALTNPVSGSFFTAPATIPLQATASDTSGTVTNVAFYAGGTLLANDATAPYGFNWTNVPVGNYALTAVATDNNGASNVSTVVNITVASSFGVALTNPVNGATFTAPATIPLQATAADLNGNVTNVSFCTGTTLLASDAAAPYAFTWTNVAAGSYALTAVAADDQGAFSTSSVVNITVTTPTAGGSNVFACVFAPHDGTTVPAGSSLGVSLLGWSTNAAVTNITLLYDGVAAGNVAAATGSLILSNLAAGIHSLAAVAVDAASNVATSAPVYIRVISAPVAGGTVSGELKLWHPVSVSFNGPTLSESGNPNPFTDYRLDVTFVNGTNVYLAPGYFAADGDAADTSATSGNQWRAKFSPVAVGTWTYYASFRTGTDVATNDNAFAGSATAFDSASGSFVVGPTDKTGNDFRAKGLLEYVGMGYLRFRGTGEYFVKSGAGSPENFLGYFEFDDTVDHGGQANNLTTTGPIDGAPGFNLNGDGLHHWAPHVADWQPGDPVWQGTKGKGIIGAVNYLGAVGGNSLYFLTMNPNGDGREVYPWTTYASAAAPDPNRYRFDCSKLDQWDIVLSHMDTKGVYKHVFLAESENCLLLDHGDLGKERRLYYRELVARFGHCLGLQWNISEESGNTPAQITAYCIYLHRLDPFYHTVHVHNGSMAALFTPQLGFPLFDGISIQEGPGSDHATTLSWRGQAIAAGHPWIIGFDEQTSAVPSDGSDASHNTIRKQALWGNLMAGGTGCEWYFGYSDPNGDLDTETYVTRSNMWAQGVIARNFFQQYLPFQNMTPNDSLSTASGSYCLAQTGVVYAVYLPSGGTSTLNLAGAPGTYTVSWYDPRNGGILQTGSVAQVTGGGSVSLGTAPNSTTSDWAVLVQALPPAQPVLTLSSPGGAPQLQWTAPGFVLEHALQITGPWSTVSPQPASPYVLPTANAREYFRLRWPGP